MPCPDVSFEALIPHHASTLQRVRAHFAEQPDVSALLLSGSIAHGYATAQSDVDIMIVVPDEQFQERLRRADTCFFSRELCTYEQGYVDGKYISAESDGDEIVFMPGSLLSLMTGYKIKPGYHQVRNTHRRDPRSALLMFVNPEINQKLEPWIRNESNAGIDIIERANEGPKQFGMPTLEDGTAGEAFPELMEHKEAVLSEQSKPVRAKA